MSNSQGQILSDTLTFLWSAWGIFGKRIAAIPQDEVFFPTAQRDTYLCTVRYHESMIYETFSMKLSVLLEDRKIDQLIFISVCVYQHVKSTYCNFQFLSG